ncbi:MAG: hypothetical protein SFZ03_04915 [Candidatus Melainabacteria bacterium]|nr:hypothetical protein [Candidatus Melainabacteria bacterium]
MTQFVRSPLPVSVEQCLVWSQNMTRPTAIDPGNGGMVYKDIFQGKLTPQGLEQVIVNDRQAIYYLSQAVNTLAQKLNQQDSALLERRVLSLQA